MCYKSQFIDLTENIILSKLADENLKFTRLFTIKTSTKE